VKTRLSLRAGNRAAALALLAALLAVPCLAGPTGSAAAVPDVGPGRLAIAGSYPTGYVGTLARCGLPRDVLHDLQLGMPAVLRQYDVLILAGAPEVSADFANALEAFFDRGGRLLYDYSTSNVTIPGVQAAERQAGLGLRPGAAQGPPSLLAGMFRNQGRALSAARPYGPNGPLTDDMVAPEESEATPATPGDADAARAARRRALLGRGGLGFVPNPAGLSDVVELAEYPKAVAGDVTPQVLQRLRQNPDEMAAQGQPMPAIVMGRFGSGRVILCGVPIGMSSSLQGTDYDQLVLGLLRVLTDGRLTPQLVPEGPHLGRKQSLRSVGTTETADAETVEGPPPAERPDGPGPRGVAPAGYVPVVAEQPDEFTVSGQVPPTEADLLLHCWNADTFVRVVIGPSGLFIRSRYQGRDRPEDIDGTTQTLAPGTPFTVKMRCDHLLVAAADAMAECDTKYFTKGGIYASTKFNPRPRCETVESVYFSDDFMRTSEHSGGWVTQGGKWYTVSVENPDMGANPFSYKVDALDTVATALQGTARWDEYRYRCAVRPGVNSGSIGLGWYAKDQADMYLFDAAVTPDVTGRPDGFRLVKLVNGQRQVLTTFAGGLVPGQWYQVDVETHGVWILVYVDGQLLLRAKDVTYRSGKIALWADHTSGRFDNVLVESWVIKPPEGARIVSKVPEYAGVIDVDSWAGPATPWEPDPTYSELFWRCHRFYGDQYLRYDVTNLPDNSTTALAIQADRDHGTGTALMLTRSGDNGVVTLKRNGQTLATAKTTLGDKVSLMLERHASLLTGWIDDQPAVRAAADATDGGQMCFETIGYKPRISGLTLWSRHLKDYTFDTAPVDWWVGSGTWDLTNRWSCTPDWSWFGGVSEEGTAVIWNKRPVAGDTLLDFYAGPKMLSKDKDAAAPPPPGLAPVRPKKLGKERFGDFNCVLCGDGRNVMSGYSFVLCPENPPEEPRPVAMPRAGAGRGRTPAPAPAAARRGGAYIYRSGVLVARGDYVMFRIGHNRWADITAEKRGDRVTLSVDGQVVVQYIDPNPLNGGYAGIWTQHNGIMVPRATISSQRVLEKPLLSLRP
jgi:hypothetical protein